MPWLIVIFVLLQFSWIIPVLWIDNPVTLGAKIGVTILVLLLALALITLIYLLCISIAMDSFNNISLPNNAEETIKVNNIIICDDKIRYCREDSTDYEKKMIPWFTLQKSNTGYNYIEIYKDTIKWKSPIREFLYGNSILSDYYVVYLTGD